MTWQLVTLILGLALNVTIMYVATTWRTTYEGYERSDGDGPNASGTEETDTGFRIE